MLIIIYNRCFPYVVNLAVQAVLSSITNLDYENDDGFGFPRWSITHDIIAVLRTLINKVGSIFYLSF